MKIEKGSTWRNKKTGRTAIVVVEPEYFFSGVQLLHETGRRTSIQQHYFLTDYERIQ
jgi:hypothetical protein